MNYSATKYGIDLARKKKILCSYISLQEERTTHQFDNKPVSEPHSSTNQSMSCAVKVDGDDMTKL